MLVDNHMNQLYEASRVLKKGAKCGFSIWGRPENSNMFNFINKILFENGVITELPTKSNFDRGSNLD